MSANAITEMVMNQRSSPRQEKVTVDAEDCAVWVAEKTPGLWIAYGDCCGKRVDAKGTSSQNALESWQKTAKALND